MSTTRQIDKNEVIKEFNQAVNMSPSEIERWLEAEDSNAVG
jgi:hypothetical protein